MKSFTTIAAVSVLTVTGWAASLPGAPAPIEPMLALQAAACPKPAPAPATTWKHGQPEYNDFLAITKATDKTEIAKLAAAFVEKYPDSNYKDKALFAEMSAQEAVPALREQAVETAEKIIKSGTADASQLLPAYTIIAYLDPSLVQPNDPNLAAKMATLKQAATCGQELLASAPAAQQQQFGLILTKALGFAQLNTKDYADAIATLKKAEQQDPKDALVHYWMGIAQVTQAVPDYNAGIFNLAKASVLAPQTAAYKNYLNTVYTSYHGSADGLNDVITAATNNATPPADFKVLSKVDVENAANMAAYQAALEKQKNTPPPEGTFQGLEWRLKRPDYASAEWAKVKGTGLELVGIVTDVTAKSVDIAVGADASTANPTPDVHLVIAADWIKRPKVGDKVTIQGLATSFKPNPPDQNQPFLLTLDKGSVTGFTPAPGSTPPTAAK
jgi:tetratricopeptide (TPR) repeat protein